MRLRPDFNDSAIVTKSKLIRSFGRWNLYEVTFLSKKAKLLLDHEVRERYANLGRVTNHFFIGLEKYER